MQSNMEVSTPNAQPAKSAYVAPRLVQIGSTDLTEGGKGNKNSNEHNYARNAVS